MSLISKLHEDLRRARITRRNGKPNGENAPRGLHKKYERMRHFKLPDPPDSGDTFMHVLSKRASSPARVGAPLSVERYGALLGLALKKRAGTTSRPYPSGGALYPVETYVLADTFEDIGPSVLHYDPSAHALDWFWALPEGTKVADLFSNSGAETPASAMIVFASCWSRSRDKYGDFSYILALLEAGHMSQNVLLAASALDIPACPIGGFDDQALSRILDLRADEEQPVHAIVV